MNVAGTVTRTATRVTQPVMAAWPGDQEIAETRGFITLVCSGTSTRSFGRGCLEGYMGRDRISIA